MKVSMTAAQEVCEASGARQVVILAFGRRGEFQVVSYGATKRECAAIRPMCDRLADDLMEGRLTLAAPPPQEKPTNG